MTTRPRHHASQAYAAIKTGTRLVIHDLGGVDAASACSRVGRSQWSDYANPHSDKFVHVDVLIDAEAIAGTPHVTAALARIHGYELIPVTPRDAGALGDALAAMSRGVGALFSTVASAFADGVLTDNERSDLQRELDDVIRLAGEARATLRNSGAKE